MVAGLKLTPGRGADLWDELSAFLDLGAAEYLEGEGVCLIEWADRVRDWLPDETLWIELAITGPDSRRARISGQASLLGPIGDSSNTSTPSL